VDSFKLFSKSCLGRAMDRKIVSTKRRNQRNNLNPQMMQFTNQKEHLIEFMKLISLTHECVIEKSKDGKNNCYVGPSPDEIELVAFAKKVGFEVTEVSKTHLTLEILPDHLDTYQSSDLSFSEDRRGNKNTQKVKYQFELLKRMEFDSTRKR
jgi:magnesium-transporting ATPase (P-type)